MPTVREIQSHGDTEYIADVAHWFWATPWDKALGAHHAVLAGLTMRYTYYDDNTPATATADSLAPQNLPTHTYLPGVCAKRTMFNPQINCWSASVGRLLAWEHLHAAPQLQMEFLDKRNTLQVSFAQGTAANVFTEDTLP